jgi:LytS/YehU family sensor histidine kinase
MSLSVAPPAGAAASPAADAASGGWARWAAIAAAWALYSLAQVGLYAVVLIPGGEGLGWTGPMMLATGLFWALATPPLLRLGRRVAPERVGLARALAAHAALALATAAAATVVRLVTLRVTGSNPTVGYLTIFASRLDFHLITYAALAVIGHAVDSHRALLRREQRVLALQGQLARARLAYLQQQLQPHFLFNALNGIAELTREAPPAAARMLRQLGELLRAATARGGAAEVTLREELDAVAPYLAVQRTRFDDAFTVAIAVQPAAADALVPTLVLQPLVENAVRHGLAGRGGAGEIVVGAEVVEAGGARRLRVRVADNGAGVAAPAGRGGIGLQNTRHRLAELYGADHRFTLTSTPGRGSVAELEIPLRTGTTASAVVPPAPASEEPDGDTLDFELADVSAAAVAADAADAPAATRAPVVAIPATPDATAMLAGGAADAAPAAEAPRPWRAAAAWAGVWLLCGFVWVAQTQMLQLLMAGRLRYLRESLVEFVAAGLWIALTPAVLWLGRRVRVTPRRWAGPLAVHLLAAGTAATVHLAVLLSPALVGRPLLASVNVYPFMTNVCIYAVIVAWMHARDLAAWHRERELAAARARAAIAAAEWQTTAVTLRPPFTLAVLEHAERLTAADPARAERTVELLADVLRTMLHSAAGGEATVREELALVGECLRLHEEATGARVRLRVELPAWALDARLPAGASGRMLALLARPGAPAGGRTAVLQVVRAAGDRALLRVRTEADAGEPAAAAPSAAAAATTPFAARPTRVPAT